MGASFSAQNPMFNQDLNKLNNLVNQLVNSKSELRSTAFVDKRCESFNIVNTKKLHKYTKFNLNNIEELLLIPKDDTHDTTKKYMCDRLNNHLNTILNIILCVRYIYDLENDGESSISGIIFKHVYIDDNSLVNIKTCESSQTDVQYFQKGVNFSRLKGFEFFVKRILSQDEAKLFIAQLSVMLDTYDIRKMKKLVCRDSLVNADTHSNIHKERFICQRGGNDDLFIRVNKHNPIFHSNTCSITKTYKSKPLKQVVSLIQKQKKNYLNNLERITIVLHSLVYYDKTENMYKLKQITHYELNTIKDTLKQNIILFYLQSLSDYKNLLNTIKIYSINHE